MSREKGGESSERAEREKPDRPCSSINFRTRSGICVHTFNIPLYKRWRLKILLEIYLSTFRSWIL